MGLFSTIGSFVGSTLAPGWGTAVGAGLGSLADDTWKEGVSDNNDSASREWQEQMYDKQYANNTQFWYEQQEFNSPKNQVQRLKDAGINPAFAIGNIQSGQMGSVGSSSVPGTNVSQRVTPQRFNDSLSSILTQKETMKNMQLTNDSLKLDNEAKEIDILTQAWRNMVDIYNTMAETDEKKANTYHKITDADIARFMAMPNFQAKMVEMIKGLSETDLNIADTVMKWEEIRYLPKDKKMLYADALADIDLKYEQRELTKQQVKTEIEKTNHEFFRSEGQKFINSLNEKTEEYVLKRAEYDAKFSAKNPFEMVTRIKQAKDGNE